MLGRSRLADSALDVPAADAAGLIANAQTGDLWLSPGRPTNFVHVLLRFLTRSRWAHIGMLLRQDDTVFLIDATLSHGVRIIPIDQAMASERNEGWSIAPVVLVRTAALAGVHLLGGLNDAEALSARRAILRRVAEGFPLNYDACEILRILGILLRGGLVRRWRFLGQRPFMQRASQDHLRKLAKTRGAVASSAAAPPATSFKPQAGSASRWIWNKLNTPEARARRINEQDPYTCIELVAALLDQVEPYRGLFRLDPHGEDFLCPAMAAEKPPLVVLGRLL